MDKAVKTTEQWACTHQSIVKVRLMVLPARPFIRNFSIFTFLLAMCVLSLGIYAMRASEEIGHADRSVARTHAVIAETQALIAGVYQMLSAQRGYLLTGQEEFSDQYRTAKTTAYVHLEKVMEMQADNPQQTARLTGITAYFSEFTTLLEKYIGPAESISEAEIAADRDKIVSLRNDLIGESQKILHEEYTILNARATILAQKMRDYRNTLFVGGSGAALLLLLFNIFLLRAQSGRFAAERSLREAENRLSLAVQGSNNGVFDCDIQSGTVYWSAQYKHILGYDEHELKPDMTMFEDLLHPDDRERALNTYHQYINDELSEYTDMFRMQHKSGRWVWIQAKGMALYDGTRGATRFVGTHTDITHLKDYESRLERERDRAEKANAAKSEFLAHMSHEIRTPLTAISGIAEILTNMQDSLDDKYKKLIHTLSSSATSLKDLIADILDFSKIESGEIELAERQFDLASLFEQVISITSIKATEKQLDYRVDYASLAEESFYGDQARLRQILINLIGNAIKFTDRGYVSVTATREMIDKMPVLVVTVKDSGVGIDPDRLDIIFEKFRQADASVSRKYGGTGLGLPISQKLTELMHGTIKVESVPGEGSTFTLYLPFKEKDVFYGANSEVAAAPILERKNHDRLLNAIDDKDKVLLVEDYEGNIVVLSHLLEDLAIEYDIARTGIEAISAWETGDYGLILMDVQMPEMDGITATKKIRFLEAERSLPRTPIIGLTAHAMVADREKCIASGMDTYLPKPIDESEFRHVIRGYLKKRPEKNIRAA